MSASFYDSNIFIYLFDDKDMRKFQIARQLVQQALQQGQVTISYQVIQKTLNVMIRKFPASATQQQSEQFLERTLLPLWQVNFSRTLYQRALDVKFRYQYSFYYALIISAALEAGCKTLYSEDL